MLRFAQVFLECHQLLIFSGSMYMHLRHLLVTAVSAFGVAFFAGCDDGGATGPDETAPAFISAPSVDGGNLTLTVDEAGTAYYVLVSQDAGAPSAQDIKNGMSKEGDDLADEFTGNSPVQASQAASLPIAVKDGMAYTIYVVVFDESGNPSSVRNVDFTSPDETAPRILSVSPTSGEVGASVSMGVKTDEAGTIYVKAVEGSTAPEVATIIEDANSGAALTDKATATADVETALEISGFSAPNTYTVYIVTEDAEGYRALWNDTRTYVSNSSSMSASVIAYGDEDIEVHVNGTIVGLDALNSETTEINAGSNVFALKLTKTPSIYGGAAIGALTWSNGANSIYTDGSWQYSFEEQSGWDSLGFDASAWGSARTLSDTIGG